ncbi:SDR family NAD(P)-dependent oxidoreductase [Roseovarius sp. 2305UL8-3]|uniref:SDR family NAD(P)-dependent oxidoreductase n=1 Tax=Roseovarius conchicola TaxID=3121636 RepID=UPI003529C0BB
MPNTALITGASAGIGREFARLHASKGDDVILTARREDSLNTLKAELEADHGITATVFALDLGAPGGAEALIEKITSAGVSVDILINNAGFGGQGTHTGRDLAAEQAMIDLNVKTLVTLTHHFGGLMAAQGGGRILNVGSTAGFMPGPNQAVYFATKAFVSSYSQAVAHELKDKGVTCTVLAPGYVETEFAKVADLDGTNLVKGGGKTAASAAKHGYDAMMRGKLITVNEPMLGLLVNWVVPLLPRRLVLKMMSDMQAK